MNLKIKAEDQNLTKVNEFVHKMLPNDCKLQTLNEIDLAIEEIFINIAHYAYKKLPDLQSQSSLNSNGFGYTEITCNFDKENSLLSVEFCDSGIPFNPLEKEDPDITLSAEKRKIGGLGIYLTKKLMNTIEYSFENGQNHLKFTKKV
ncbi:MAG: ATP-binding protein [Treponema sp.]|nr:ATP-binding protein [Treponema sp.]